MAVALLVLLITDWKPYSKHYQAFTGIFTLVAGLAIAAVTLLRHFAQTDAWLAVPKGTCEKIVGGSLTGKKD